MRPAREAAVPHSGLDAPLVSFGREICGDLAAALRREWIVTNGLGGYASGTVAGINTRRYHGLLVAALTPPVGRTVLVAELSEWASIDGRRYPLSTHEYADGTIDPRGDRYMEAFALDGMLPVWTYAFEDVLLEKRIWMAHGTHTTYVAYRLVRSDRPVSLEVTPLVTYRDFHALRSGQGWQPQTVAGSSGVAIRVPEKAEPHDAPPDAAPAVATERPAGIPAPPDPPACRLLSADGRFHPGGAWWWNFLRREEAARGLDDREDLYAPGRFTLTVTPGRMVTIAATTEPDPDLAGPRALAAAQERQEHLLRQADAQRAHPVVGQLTLAADQFLVRRDTSAGAQAGGAPGAAGPAGSGRREATARGTPPDAGQASRRDMTVIAGYHWFNDWGRDTTIALPGLALSTGRAGDAAAILNAFAGFVRDGLLPNNFPDHAGEIPHYNTADASLWYVLAVRAHHEATGDGALLDELLPVLHEIVDRHVGGTRYGIGMDPRDGLLRAGVPGVQLTWMDAKVGDAVITPRVGKPVEINALWYNVLRTLAAMPAKRDEPTAPPSGTGPLGLHGGRPPVGRQDARAAQYGALADRVRASFRAKFRRDGYESLADVVDGPDGDDLTVRANQIFAVSLPFPLLEGGEAAAVVRAVRRALLTTYGLRSLAPGAPEYRGIYAGDVWNRDGAYHEGTVWAWLIGAYAEAYHRVSGDREGALRLLRPFEDHLRDAGLGTISEIFDGDPPHHPRGCIAQAWSVAEVLRVWRTLENPDAPRRAAAGAPGPQI